MKHQGKDTAHLVRLGLLYAGGFALLFVARAVFIPPTFGDLGHYRAATIDDVRHLPPVHAGAAACAECHEDQIKKLATGRHQSVRCEACHEALGAHAEAPEKVDAVKPDMAALCVRCHLADAAKPEKFPQIVPQDHNPESACKECHEAHKPGI